MPVVVVATGIGRCTVDGRGVPGPRPRPRYRNRAASHSGPPGTGFREPSAAGRRPPPHCARPTVKGIPLSDVGRRRGGLPHSQPCRTYRLHLGLAGGARVCAAIDDGGSKRGDALVMRPRIATQLVERLGHRHCTARGQHALGLFDQHPACPMRSAAGRRAGRRVRWCAAARSRWSPRPPGPEPKRDRHRRPRAAPVPRSVTAPRTCWRSRIESACAERNPHSSARRNVPLCSRLRRAGVVTAVRGGRARTRPSSRPRRLPRNARRRC